MRDKMAISKFWSVDFGEKMSEGGGLYAECDGVIFVKILWLLGGVFPYFLK